VSKRLAAGLGLADLLITPVQRVPRYRMLLEEVPHAQLLQPLHDVAAEFRVICFSC
jgi:hypothetical protein